jgi:ATP-binding cassette subfamily F protein 3
VISLENVGHAYGSNVVYDGTLSLEVERGSRIVLVGPNGAGKSTLMKLMAGVIDIQKGTRDLGHEVHPGYFAQYRMEGFDPSQTVLEAILDTKSRITEQFARTVLGCFLFRGDDVFKKVSILSGGEKTRLRLVKLLVEPPNFLLMDEPTTHLDMASIDALVNALKQFQGSLVFISHDVYFIKAIASQVWHVEGGKVTRYAGNYDYYLDKTGAGSAQDSLPQTGKQKADSENVNRRPNAGSAASRKEQKRLEAIERQKKSGVRKAQKEKVDRLEAEITTLESRIAEIYSMMEDPATFEDQDKSRELQLELRQAESYLPMLQENWEKEAEKLENI